MTNVVTGILIGLAALLAAKFWLEKLSPSPEPEAKDREKPAHWIIFIKTFISLAAVFSIIYVMNFAPYAAAMTTAVGLAAFCSYLSARVFFEYGIRQQTAGVQTGIFALWVIQFAGIAFGFVEYVTARANFT